jgi:hypothetical protein
MAQRTEREHNSLKADAFIRRICWNIVILADHIIHTIPCCDAPKIGTLWTERQWFIMDVDALAYIGSGILLVVAPGQRFG